MKKNIVQNEFLKVNLHDWKRSTISQSDTISNLNLFQRAADTKFS